MRKKKHLNVREKIEVQNTFKRHVCNIVLSIFTRRSCLIRSCNIRNNTHCTYGRSVGRLFGSVQTKRHSATTATATSASMILEAKQSHHNEQNVFNVANTTQLLCSLYQDKVENCSEQLWVGFMSLIQHLTTTATATFRSPMMSRMPHRNIA